MIRLKSIPATDMRDIWRIGYSEENPKWAQTDAPFLHDYQAQTWQQFEQTEVPFFQSNQVQGIYLDDRIIGAVAYYWESEQTRWLEIGMSIFDSHNWSKGYGRQALAKWTTKLFKQYPEIERLGYSTWSANQGMILIGQKLGYLLEGRLRNVRYYKGIYYDEIKMGVLRSEWFI